MIGIDHGAMSGWGLIQGDKFIGCDMFLADSKGTGKKLSKYRTDVLDILKRTQPDIVVVEQPSHRRNALVSILLDGYYNMIQVAAHEHGIPPENVIQAHPASIKKLVAGHGHASKEEVAIAISDRLNVSLDKITHKEFYKVNGKKYKKGDVRVVHYDMSDALALALFGNVVKTYKVNIKEGE